jgi:diguanylate cyclase (GGDEF)-like protein/PAS domain S-box-containing protein
VVTNRWATNDYAAALLARCRDVVAVVAGDGILTYASAGAELMLGYHLTDLVGRNAFDLVHPDDQIDAFEGFVSTTSSPDSRPTPLLMRLRHADGGWIDAEVVATNHLADPAVSGLLLTIRDVSSSMRTDASLRESEERYRLIVELAHEGIWMVDARGAITYANRSLARMLRTTVSDLLGRSIFDFIENDERERAMTFARRGVATKDAHDFRLLAADGTALWVRVSATPLRLHDGSNNGIVAVVTDVTERRALEERLARDARSDPLTGVANRHALFHALSQTLQRASSCAVLFADIDHFKQVNDTYGHRVGDEVLKVVAGRISAEVRDHDIVARVGGDEFVIVCAPLDNLALASSIGARIVSGFAQPICVPDATVTITMSVGIALATRHDDPDSVLARADHALYSAKRAGRNRLEIADKR